jgi:hypothetical protein
VPHVISTQEAAFDHFDKVQLAGEEDGEEGEEGEEKVVAKFTRKTNAQKRKTKAGPALYELSGDKDAAISINPPAASGTSTALFFKNEIVALLAGSRWSHSTLCSPTGKRKREKQSLEERLKSVVTTNDGMKRHADGAMQLTFVPKTGKKLNKVPASSPHLARARTMHCEFKLKAVCTVTLTAAYVATMETGRTQQQIRVRRRRLGRRP